MMTRAHCDLCCQAAAGAGYNTANNMEYGGYQTNNAMAATAAALEGLVETAHNNLAAVANLTTANNTLTNQVKTINKLKGVIKDLAIEVKMIKNVIKTMSPSPTTTDNPRSNNNINTNNNNNNDLGVPPRVYKRVQSKWCWICGVNRGHTSAHCKYPAPGHQVNATPKNMMGINPFGMHHS